VGIAGKILQSIVKPVGYKLVKIKPAQQAILCPKLPRPTDETIHKALDNFANEFDICHKCTMSGEEIRRKFDSFFWHYPFQIGPDISIESDDPLGKGLHGRHFQRYKHFFPALLSLTGGTLEEKTVLDCGCNCGFWSIQAIKNGAKSVLGFDAGEKNIEQANFLKHIIGLQHVVYRTLDIFEIGKDTLGQFDISFFLGLLYHLNRPVEALARLKEVTSGIAVIDTTWAVSDQAILVVRSDTVHDQNFSNALCMWPSPSAVYQMLIHVGFKKVWLVQHASNDLPPDYLQGERGTFLAKV
jgi:2-polyprenyl-3-methyl-5-hydroxy-6-metoxy-1,4-benzoquinol methylase